MKKSVLVLMAALSCASIAQAAENKMQVKFNNFKDSFTLEGASVVSLQAEGNLAVASQTSASFILTDSNPNISNNGSVTLRVTNKSGGCELVIDDGPLYLYPSVDKNSVSCTPGLTFVGLTNPMFYQYVLQFK